MKAINTMQFITNMSIELSKCVESIRSADSYGDAKKKANYSLGLLDGLHVFVNTMICSENNDFTGDMDDVMVDWMAKIFQALIDNASNNGESAETIFNLCVKRDEYRDS